VEGQWSIYTCILCLFYILLGDEGQWSTFVRSSENRLFPFHVRYCGFLKLLWAFILLFGSGAERTTSEDIALSGDGKVGKGGQSKHKKKKRHGCVFQNFNLTLFNVRYCHS
jgi:hypothetical protein